MKTLREMMDIIESAQTVDESWIDHDAPEPLAKHFAELYYNGLSSKDEAKMTAHVYQQVIDGEMSIEELKQHIAKLEKERGLSEEENQEYTVRVVDEEGSGYTVKVTATSEQGALHKAIVRVRNSGARPEHARIIRQDVAEEQLEETELDPVRRVEELFRDRH